LEDTSGRNKKLLKNLSDRSEVESSWHVGGKVWMKLKAGGQKMRAHITDDLNDICRPQPGDLFQPITHEESTSIANIESTTENAETTTPPQDEGDADSALILNAN
jgi:hypothetical protein